MSRSPARDPPPPPARPPPAASARRPRPRCPGRCCGRSPAASPVVLRSGRPTTTGSRRTRRSAAWRRSRWSQVRADGFGEFERGRVEQCVIELGRQTACGDRLPGPVRRRRAGGLPVRRPGRDRAPGGCRVGQPTCLLRLTGHESGRQGMAQTVVGDRLRSGAGRRDARPGAGRRPGRSRSRCGGFRPARRRRRCCAPRPEAYDARRCTVPGRRRHVRHRRRRVGRTTLACPPAGSARTAPCAAPPAVRRDGGGRPRVRRRADRRRSRFSTGPGVAYDRERVMPGVGIALVLVAAAVVIARRTDWTKPTEAATPELDDADLRSDRTWTTCSAPTRSSTSGIRSPGEAPGRGPSNRGVRRRAW